MKNTFFQEACKKWIDVRAFGQVFAFSGKSGGGGVSIGVRGPVSIHPAFSVATVLDRVTSLQITKSVSGEGDGTKRGSDTMGMKHRVDHGVYVFYGSINPQLAEKTGFTEKDSQAVKMAITSLFRNDASSARPEGSMEIYKVYWWEHNNKTGQFSSAKVHRSVSTKIYIKDLTIEPNDITDYYFPSKEEVEADLPGLNCEILSGE